MFASPSSRNRTLKHCWLWYVPTQSGQKNPRPKTEPERTETETEQTEHSVLGPLFGFELLKTDCDIGYSVICIG
jgi:hypothetical protein